MIMAILITIACCFVVLVFYSIVKICSENSTIESIEKYTIAMAVGLAGSMIASCAIILLGNPSGVVLKPNPISTSVAILIAIACCFGVLAMYSIAKICSKNSTTKSIEKYMIAMAVGFVGSMIAVCAIILLGSPSGVSDGKNSMSITMMIPILLLFISAGVRSSSRKTKI